MPLSFARPQDRSRLGTGFVLKALVWLFSLGLIAAGWLVALQQIRFERELTIADAIAQNENRAVAFEQYIRRTLEVAAIATRYVADRFRRGEPGSEFVGSAERPTVMPGGMAREVGTFLGAAIINTNGDVVASSRPNSPPLNVANHPAFRVHIERDSGGLYVSHPLRLPGVPRQIILLTRRLSNPDGSFAGVVALSILPEQFTAFYRDARVGQGDVISLIGLDGITRARRTGDISSAGEDLRGGLVMRMQMRNPNGTYIGPSVLDGIVRIFSHRRLDGYPLFATYGVRIDEVLALPRRRARVLIAAVVAGTLAVLGFAIVLTLLVNRGERRAHEVIAANERLERAQRIGEIGDWRYGTADDPLYWSPQIYALYERDPTLGPMPTAEFRALLDDEGRATIDRAMERANATGETQQFEFKATLPSGTEVHHQVVAMPIRDAEGRVVEMHGTTQNISGRKLIEQLQTRLAHLSRIDAMNAMAATLAHELNQPLAAAANFLAGSRRGIEAQGGPEPIAEGVTSAEQQIHFAADIIRRVREMVSNQPRTLSRFALEAVVDDALALIGAAKDRPPFSVSVEPAARYVRADRVQVQQVLINLLRNAIEATAGRPDSRIEVAARSMDGLVEVSVSDNGSGFRQPPAERFSPQTSPEGGMGLGLSISRTIVEAHGGRIWTGDREGGGAVVSFTLPAASEADQGA